MSVEVSVYAVRPAVTWEEVRAAGARRGLELRLLDPDGHPLPQEPTGPLGGDFVAIGWPTPHTDTTAAVDRPLQAHERAPIDALGREHRLAWCSLQVTPFDYDRFWSAHGAERKEFEATSAAGQLAFLRRATVRYSLRSGLRPPPNARLVGYLARWLAELTKGVLVDS